MGDEKGGGWALLAAGWGGQGCQLGTCRGPAELPGGVLSSRVQGGCGHGRLRVLVPDTKATGATFRACRGRLIQQATPFQAGLPVPEEPRACFQGCL